VANFRKGFYTDSRYGLLAALGEEPEEYKQAMESLLEDLQPRPGLETHLAEQMAETFWRMRRAQRMRDGLALRSIHKRVEGEELLVNTQASKVIELLEPFDRLQEALERRGDGPTAEEIDDFLHNRKGETTPAMQEFIQVLNSLKESGGEAERKALRQKARKQFADIMETYDNLRWRYTRKVERVHSPENLAALMAPDDERSTHLQRMEDLYLRRLWRLINAFEKVRQGGLHGGIKNIASKATKSMKTQEEVT